MKKGFITSGPGFFFTSLSLFLFVFYFAHDFVNVIAMIELCRFN